MHITCVMVESINGKITKGDNPNIYEWTSEEDAYLFSSLVAANNLIVMGSKTYQAAKNIIVLDPQKLRVVLTRQPEKFVHEAVDGQLAFSNERVADLVTRLEGKGYERMLLVGGGEINSLFFAAGLVNELFVTIEPLVIADGHTLVGDKPLEVDFTLEEIKQINDKGTLHAHYKIKPF